MEVCNTWYNMYNVSLQQQYSSLGKHVTIGSLGYELRTK